MLISISAMPIIKLSADRMVLEVSADCLVKLLGIGKYGSITSLKIIQILSKIGIITIEDWPD